MPTATRGAVQGPFWAVQDGDHPRRGDRTCPPRGGRAGRGYLVIAERCLIARRQWEARPHNSLPWPLPPAPALTAVTARLLKDAETRRPGGSAARPVRRRAPPDWPY